MQPCGDTQLKQNEDWNNSKDEFYLAVPLRNSPLVSVPVFSRKSSLRKCEMGLETARKNKI
jgi:hypothetical protein